jgi:hypothetical protein
MKSSRQQRKIVEVANIINDPVLFAQLILGQHIWSKQIG